jgi:hypothetical protein
VCELCEFVVWFWCWVGFCCFVVAGLWFCLGGCGFEKGLKGRPDQARRVLESQALLEERASERAGVEQCQLRKGVRLTAGAGAQRPLSAF